MASPPGVDRKARRATVARRSVVPLRGARSSLPTGARERFRSADRYRADREWLRYEGTAQRELFRVLRERFLARHSRSAGFALDVGSGPGRFTPRLGANSPSRRIALDIGREMLAQLPMRWAEAGNVEPLPDRIQGDGVRPPLAPGSFGLVAALGNLLGFAGAEGDALVASLVALLAPGGTLLLEVAPGPGERSRYLHRLPGSSVTRLLRSPPRFVASRIAIEGFTEEPRRRAVPGEFQRFDPATLRDRLEARGLLVEEIVAVAPALGPDATRAEAVARDPKAWGHLLEVEELVGRVPDRWPAAAAVLMAAVGPGAEEKGTRSPVRRSEG